MNSPPNSTSDREERLHEVIAAYLEADQAGHKPSREELLDRHPDLGPELQAFFADHDKLKRWAEPKPTPSRRPAASAEPAAGAQVRYFGDYELLAEIARGGMGVVYRALQRSLKRVVALKMIRTWPLATSADLERFRIEAETVANLDHPNIVPIHEVGEYQGQPYFTMKYIDGGNLTQHLPRLHGDPREAARLLAAVARAVHHAHERGLLHRDLKPANILVDHRGEPHITDFGLVKQVAQFGEGLTQTGDILGTPSYMSPEQASGRSHELTTAADVYSLGAILYELLTERPPFKAGTPLDTLRQVADQEPRRPRNLNPRVPRALETICLKCLRKDPRQRYASAEALAEDLERFLGDQPIHARRLFLRGGMGAWPRRRLVTWLLLLAGLVLLASGFTTLRLRQQQAMLRAEQAWRQQMAARQQAEANFQKAHQAVDELFAHAVDKRPAGEQPLEPARRKLLEEALNLYRHLEPGQAGGPTPAGERANVFFRMGEIQSLLDDFSGAEQSLRQGIAILTKQTRQARDANTYWAKLTSAYLSVGTALVAQGKHQEAAVAIDRLFQQGADRAEDYRRGAGILARCTPLAAKDARLPPEERQALAQKYADQAMKLLREAVQRGFKSADQLHRADDLEALRSRDDFKKLIRDLEGGQQMGPP